MACSMGFMLDFVTFFSCLHSFVGGVSKVFDPFLIGLLAVVVLIYSLARRPEEAKLGIFLSLGLEPSRHVF